MHDCVVIGGGPAGLTAAIYLARYHLSVAVFDDDTSRAASIPMSHNHAGFPDGINGRDLLNRMRTQALRHGVDIRAEKVTELHRTNNGFRVLSHEPLDVRSVLLATGVVNRRPAISAELHDTAVSAGLVRYCPVCDGFEITDKPIAVIGSGSRAFKEVVFLRSYTKSLTLVSDVAEHGLSAEEAARLEELGVAVRTGPVEFVSADGGAIEITARGQRFSFAAVYPALGSDVRSHLAEMVGAELSDEGCVTVDAHQRTTVVGLYAAGDVVIGLDQISNAMGQAGVAATSIRYDLCDSMPLIRR